MKAAQPDSASMSSLESESIALRLAMMREAQRHWSAVPIRERLQIIRRVRETIAVRAMEYAQASASLRARPIAEVLSAEVLPLLEAHRFVEREADDLLATQKLGREGRPFWLNGVDTEIRREPRGIVLVIGPGNYPLLLPGIQILQALAAGNSVLLKPAPGTTGLATLLRDEWIAAGFPAGAFAVLSEAADVAHEVIRIGVDFVVLTGSAAGGEAVLKTCAEKLTQSVMELSGCDAVIVREDADVELTADALAFGVRINAGATCIAPRRVFVVRRVAERLEAHLTQRFDGMPSFSAPERCIDSCRRLFAAAQSQRATVLAGELYDGQVTLPLVIMGGDFDGAQIADEIFGPVLMITVVDGDEQAIALAARSPYALGASVFSRDEESARRIAERINAGVVLVNDMVVPTADPRIPFGGRGRSGFGVTRGAEGLLTMTVPKVVSVTKGKRRPHFAPVGESEEQLFAGYIAAAHGGSWGQRLRGLRRLWAALKTLSRSGRQKQPFDLHHDQK